MTWVFFIWPALLWTLWGVLTIMGFAGSAMSILLAVAIAVTVVMAGAAFFAKRWMQKNGVDFFN